MSNGSSSSTTGYAGPRRGGEGAHLGDVRLAAGRAAAGVSGDVPRGDVGGLTRVADHVVELGAPVAEVLHELELAVPDRGVRVGGRRCSAGRARTASRRSTVAGAGEDRGDADPVELACPGSPPARSSAVGSTSMVLVSVASSTPGRHRARPVRHQRHPDAALVELALAAAQRPVGVAVGAAVVGGHEQQRVVGDAEVARAWRRSGPPASSMLSSIAASTGRLGELVGAGLGGVLRDQVGLARPGACAPRSWRRAGRTARRGAG